MIDVKPPTAWDNPSDECSLTFRQILRPSLISMAVSGCYTYDPYEIKTGRPSDKGKPYRVFGTIYRVAVFIFCLGAFAQACAAFSTISSNFIPLGIVRVGWFTQCVVVLLLSFKFSHANTPASNLGYLAPPPGQFFMGAKLFIGTPRMGNEGVLKKFLVWAM